MRFPSLPDEWRLITEHAVGGLVAVGVGPDDRHVLVVSFQGRGVFDTITGERVARDPDDEMAWLDTEARRAIGIGPLEGRQIAVAGLWGGELPSATEDGWSVTVNEREKGETTVHLGKRGTTKRWLIERNTASVRVAGFSESGTLLIVGATDITIWRRKPES